MKQIEIVEAQKNFYKLITELRESDDYFALVENKKPVAILLTFSDFCKTLGVSQDLIKENLSNSNKNLND
jgi:PHD/YefM family antitoxin component YafN of YafNO toxin-antitoxin module